MKKLISQKNLLIIILATVILLYLAVPLFKSGLPLNNDLEIYLTWYTEFEQNIKDGNLIPHWSPNTWYGLGSPLFNFVSPGFYYLIGFFRLFGSSILISVKLAIYLCLLLGFVFMFLLAKKLWGKWPALLCTTIYTFFPYHLGLVFTRGDYAELLAMALFPVNLFLFYKLIKKRGSIYFLLVAITIALQILAHNILSIIFLAVVMLFIFFFVKKPYRNYYLPISALLLGVLIASFFWLPAFVEKSHINLEELTEGVTMTVGHYDFHQHFVRFQELVHVQSEFYLDHSPKFLSYLGIIIIITSLVLFLKYFKRGKEWSYLSFFLFILAISLFMSTSLSVFVWESIPLLELFQYPSRFLSIAGLAIAGLAGVIVFVLKNDKQKIFCITLAFLFIFTAINYTWPNEYLEPREDQFYSPPQIVLSNMKKALIQEDWWSAFDKINLYSMQPAIIYKNVSVPHVQYLRTEMLVDTAKLIQDGEEIQLPLFKKLEHPDDLEVLVEDIKTTEYDLEILASQPTYLTVNTFWFPGWQIYIDGNQLEQIELTPYIRTMQLPIPEGQHSILIKFQDTPIRIIGKIISLLALITTLITYLLIRRMRKSEDAY